MQVLQADWNSQGVRFPTRFTVVLFHQVDLSRPVDRLVVSTTHSGLLFPAGKGFVYLEKDGGCGPFMRLDIGKLSDLLAWLAWKNNNDFGTHVFVTFNDGKIVRLPPPP